MILTKEAIIKSYELGSIIIEPFNPDLVSINSVDVRLGPDLWKMKERDIRDVYSPSENDWIKVEPFKVSHIRETTPNFASGTLEDSDEVFIFKSGEFYLATTLERVGTARPKPGASCIVPEIKAKSTVGRQGLTVALCAGLGDVGYSSQWALEVRVTNDGDVPLAVGTPIAQVVFAMASPTVHFYNGDDRYQNNDLVRFLPKPLKVIKE